MSMTDLPCPSLGSLGPEAHFELDKLHRTGEHKGLLSREGPSSLVVAKVFILDNERRRYKEAEEGDGGGRSLTALGGVYRVE